ncbi:MAG: hypothetical protein ACREFQ_19450, partial [Stellaceae bacterium]
SDESRTALTSSIATHAAATTGVDVLELRTAIEALGLVGGKLGFSGRFWDGVGTLNGNFNGLGFAIVGVFIAAWALSYAIYRIKGLDAVPVRTASRP